MIRGLVDWWLAQPSAAGASTTNLQAHGPQAVVVRVVVTETVEDVYGGSGATPPAAPTKLPPIGSDSVTHARVWCGSTPPA